MNKIRNNIIIKDTTKNPFSKSKKSSSFKIKLHVISLRARTYVGDSQCALKKFLIIITQLMCSNRYSVGVINICNVTELSYFSGKYGKITSLIEMLTFSVMRCSWHRVIKFLWHCHWLLWRHCCVATEMYDNWNYLHGNKYGRIGALKFYFYEFKVWK